MYIYFLPYLSRRKHMPYLCNNCKEAKEQEDALLQGRSGLPRAWMLRARNASLSQ